MNHMKHLRIPVRAPDHPKGGNPRPNPASTGRRLKRNVRVGNRRTTIVLEAYVWDCIDAMLARENVTLDAFCNMVETVRRHSSMASSAVVTATGHHAAFGQYRNPQRAGC